MTHIVFSVWLALAAVAPAPRHFRIDMTRVSGTAAGATSVGGTRVLTSTFVSVTYRDTASEQVVTVVVDSMHFDADSILSRHLRAGQRTLPPGTTLRFRVNRGRVLDSLTSPVRNFIAPFTLEAIRLLFIAMPAQPAIGQQWTDTLAATGDQMERNVFTTTWTVASAARPLLALSAIYTARTTGNVSGVGTGTIQAHVSEFGLVDSLTLDSHSDIDFAGAPVKGTLIVSITPVP